LNRLQVVALILVYARMQTKLEKFEKITAICAPQVKNHAAAELGAATNSGKDWSGDRRGEKRRPTCVKNFKNYKINKFSYMEHLQDTMQLHQTVYI
jgi:hypothetical protein